MPSCQHWQFTDECKAGAVRLVAEEGRSIAQVNDNAHAVWTPATATTREQFIEASDGALRWFAWQERDADGSIVDLLPVDAFGPLPAPLHQ